MVLFSLEHPTTVSHRSFIDIVRPWAELVYFLTGPILVGITLFGLQQLKLTKEDMSVKNERAAKEKALEYATRYASNFLSLSFEAVKISESKSIKWPKTTVANFTFDSVSQENLTAAETLFKDAEIGPAIVSALNELQTISAAFYSGVADETIGFDIMGPAFCHSVGQYYAFICTNRKSSTPYIAQASEKG